MKVLQVYKPAVLHAFVCTQNSSYGRVARLILFLRTFSFPFDERAMRTKATNSFLSRRCTKFSISPALVSFLSRRCTKFSISPALVIVSWFIITSVRSQSLCMAMSGLVCASRQPATWTSQIHLSIYRIILSKIWDVRSPAIP